MAEQSQMPVNKDPQAIKALKDISETKGKLDVKGMAPFLVNMGGKPYVDTGGLKLKLQEVANKRKGIKTILTIMGSYAHESPEEMLQLAKALPQQIIDQMCKERDYMAEMFTAPKGTAVAKCIIVFGDGLKVEAKATASPENIQMSTIKPHADVMAQTRAFNRCVRYITANGFLDVENMVKEEDAEDETVFEGDDVEFFRNDGNGNTEDTRAYQESEQSEEGNTGTPGAQPVIFDDRSFEEVEQREEQKTCVKCGREISQAEKEYSEKYFKQALCRTCQGEARKRA